jgi:DNA helicase-2/ATP-dependent DNA helicase PcrA
VPFYADLHVHSRYSRATSKDCDLEHLALWARKKGLAVVATGDFTHPGWMAELRAKLVPAEPGLFRLKPEIEREVDGWLPEPGGAAAGAAGAAAPDAVRFLLSVEISTIYKEGEKTRKVHHLIYVPEFEAADRVVARLARIGNLASDGRPILGLHSRDLLAIALESGPASYLVPAHVWTPWFSALGSRSGFDSIEECYGDLSSAIFAVETGLSSDPPMNWRVSALDRFRLVSNSDAHSPPKLGREACAFDCARDYFGIRRALETGEGFVGTVEFFPEEGKYHLDGHRKCGVRLAPEETRRNQGRCPACGGEVTLGVQHRVEELADRGEAAPPATAGAVRNLIPLPEILAELHRQGVGTRAVEASYEGLVARLGPELHILEHADLAEIGRRGSDLLAEAIARLRRGEVHRQAGYDGEYGVIRLFSDQELRQASGGVLFDLGGAADAPPARRGEPPLPSPGAPPNPAPQAEAAGLARPSGRVEASGVAPTVGGDPPGGLLAAAGPAESPPAIEVEPPGAASLAGAGGAENPLLAGLDPEQRAAAEAGDGPLLIVAGPGSGKTRTLTHRLAFLVEARGVPPERCLAITFTRRAAGELRERLATLLPGDSARVAVHTLHSLALSLLREHREAAGLPEGFRVAGPGERLALLREVGGASARAGRKLLERISRARRMGAARGGQPASQRESATGEPWAEEAAGATDLPATLSAYARRLAAEGLLDVDDLIERAADLLAARGDLAERCRERFAYLFLDEYQDLDAQQYRLVQLLSPAGARLTAIGDPDQAIYGFRGADVRFFGRFSEDFPGARVVRLRRNYRSMPAIVRTAGRVIAGSASAEAARRSEGEGARVAICEAPTERAEAEQVVQTIEELLGGHSFFSLDSGRGGGGRAALSFGEIAVLYRTEAQAGALSEALARSGMPYQRRSHAPLAELPEIDQLLGRMWSGSRGGSVAERLGAAALALIETPPAEAVEEDAEARGRDLRRRLEEALEILQPLARACGSDLARFHAEVMLALEVDTLDARADRISLLTLHAAKGLEFPVVFLVGCEDGLLPLRWGPAEDAVDLEEERRLFYVGVTRARDRLYLSRACRRFLRGEVRERAPSPFLKELDDLLDRRVAEPGRPSRGPDHRQLSLF